MSFYETSRHYRDHAWDRLFRGSSDNTIIKAIGAETSGAEEFAALLSIPAALSLEAMARRAHELTLRYFGRTIQLYTPLYLSNHCENSCLYCGFNTENRIERKRLEPDEVEAEAKAIASTGLKHILVLTGESRRESPVSYIKDCVKRLGKHFPSISIEVYALTEAEYGELIGEGVDGLTIYQEVYDETIYLRMHPSGPKADYRFRLDAPERGARAGMRNVNIGVLLGLNDWRREIFLAGLHAKYLHDAFPEVDIGVSIPRLRPHAGPFTAPHDVTDRDLVQAIAALRIFLPRLSLTVSTRENAAFRENIMPLGITRMSAGSTTSVGGHAARAVQAGGEESSCQFEISDERSVSEIKEMLAAKGYQPVLKDWMHI